MVHGEQARRAPWTISRPSMTPSASGTTIGPGEALDQPACIASSGVLAASYPQVSLNRAGWANRGIRRPISWTCLPRFRVDLPVTDEHDDENDEDERKEAHGPSLSERGSTTHRRAGSPLPCRVGVAAMAACPSVTQYRRQHPGTSRSRAPEPGSAAATLLPSEWSKRGLSFIVHDLARSLRRTLGATACRSGAPPHMRTTS